VETGRRAGVSALSRVTHFETSWLSCRVEIALASPNADIPTETIPPTRAGVRLQSVLACAPPIYESRNRLSSTRSDCEPMEPV
jgi:hypothetical protein